MYGGSGPARAQRTQRQRVWFGVVAGLLTAAVAVGVGQLVSGLGARPGAPAVAVGQAAIDLAPSGVKNFAISAFGADDKTVLLGGILVVLAIFAAVIGVLAMRRLAYGYAGLSVFALIGLAAALTRPGSTVAYAVPTIIGALAGAFVLRQLIHAAEDAIGPAASLRSPPARTLSRPDPDAAVTPTYQPSDPTAYAPTAPSNETATDPAPTATATTTDTASTAGTEPAKAGAANAEPATTRAARAEPATPGTADAEAATPDIADAERATGDGAGAEPAATGPAGTEPPTAGAAGAGPAADGTGGARPVAGGAAAPGAAAPAASAAGDRPAQPDVHSPAAAAAQAEGSAPRGANSDKNPLPSIPGSNGDAAGASPPPVTGPTARPWTVGPAVTDPPANDRLSPGGGSRPRAARISRAASPADTWTYQPPSRPGRRRFLVASGVAAAAAAVTGFAGRELNARQSVTQARSAIRFPAPATPAPPLPAGTDFRLKGLSPFITPDSTFYRVDTAIVLPEVAPQTWSLRIHGMVEREITISFAELLRRPLIEHYLTLTCVSNPVAGPYVGNAKWLGASLAALIREARPKAGTTQLLCTSADGFTSGTPLQTVLDGREALLAVAMNGAALPVQHGFPARMVVPGLYGYVSATKWVTDIKVTTFEAENAYWVDRGWSQQAPIKTESRIDIPFGGATISPGRTAVAGVAWAQHRGVDAVEVRVDQGPWQQAKLAAVPGIDTWRQWLWYWDATPGSHTIEARATDGTGHTQTAVQAPTEPNGATGYPATTVTVRS